MYKLRYGCIMSVIICLTLIFTFLGNNAMLVYAEEIKLATATNAVINSVISVNIDGGYVTGNKTGYQIELPNATLKHLKVERVLLSDTNTIVEKVNFYCNPPSKKYKPQLLFTFYVFKKAKWSEEYMLTELMTTKDYIYAVKIYEDNPFTDTSTDDKAIYTFLLNTIGNKDAIKKSIAVTKSQQIVTESTLLVNSSKLEETVTIIDNVYYIPLRAVCEKLEYTVKWSESTGYVTISKDSFTDSFRIANNLKTPKGGKITIVNGRTYISSQYFLRVLDCILEIDESGNLNIMPNN